MLNALLHLVTARPDLLFDHAQAYAELARQEVGKASADWQRRLLLRAAALGGFVLAVGLAGVATMLWAVMPPAGPQAGWVLVAVPIPPAAAALWCLWSARQTAQEARFGLIGQQLQADLAMLRERATP